MASKYPPPVGEPPAVQFIAVDRLQVDPSYQRTIEDGPSQRLIKRIAEQWDWRLCMPLLVAQRAEGLFVIDGQHRTEAARLRGDIPHLPCAVVAFGAVSEEAKIFARANDGRKPMTKLDIYHANVAAGDIESVTIDQLVRDAGMSVAQRQNPLGMQPGQLNFTGALYMALRRHGRPVLSAALTVMGEVFGRQILPRGRMMLEALVFIFANPADDHDPDELRDVLATMSADEWTSHPIVESYAGSGMGRSYRVRQAIEAEIAQYRSDQQ